MHCVAIVDRSEAGILKQGHGAVLHYWLNASSGCGNVDGKGGLTDTRTNASAATQLLSPDINILSNEKT
jgi:hypothetical protein